MGCVGDSKREGGRDGKVEYYERGVVRRQGGREGGVQWWWEGETLRGKERWEEECPQVKMGRVEDSTLGSISRSLKRKDENDEEETKISTTRRE